MSTASTDRGAENEYEFEERESVIIRFAGDSGDGMQLVGGQFTNASAVYGNDVSTFPDFPAEIRAPAGTLAGVSGFQIHFSNHDIKTPGDVLDALVAMNPAALKTNLPALQKGGVLICNTDSFTLNDLKKAGYAENPLDGHGIDDYMVVKIDMTRLNRDAVGKDTPLSQRAVDRCKNFFALGLLYWLYDRPTDPTLNWIKQKFGKMLDVCEANERSLRAGYNYGETLELFTHRYRVKPAKDTPPGKYRQIMGNQALAYGMVTAAKMAQSELVYATYPITPASDILHELAKLKHFRARTYQAEDEIAAMGAAIGAAYGGKLAATGTSGPGLALKAEAIGLAVMAELPVVIVNVQRGGPSTGLPTKTEQADLLQAMFGRNGECPVPIVAAAHPSDCFTMIQEAFRIAVEFMTPVIFLSDGYIANGAEPWKIPEIDGINKIEIKYASSPNGNGSAQAFQPYTRDEKLARPWAPPGIPGCEHRIGGLEKEAITGNVSYDPENHQKMIHLRQEKVDGIANSIPEQTVTGPEEGDLLLVSWGGTFGAVSTAAAKARDKGQSVAHAHLKYLSPFPKNLGDLLGRYRQVLVPELNMGQLRLLLRGHFLVDAKGYNKVKGQPFYVSELEKAIDGLLED
ncbi:2-oxoglutarate oxidoreductase subunit KorA [Planctomycetes bacterium Pan216]|uniref:2-oxoglutarate oxidoreductase subunit KorA n=1 Tax=Kolteria novifilia TaxID=2527975 RepID=A0A518AXP3_9BACT|nr:2-oxoglutarate oxidoreductase subunit KorA [Planctomycetes bacterium Pan216]